MIIRPQKSNKLNAGKKIEVHGKVKAFGNKVSLDYSFVLEDGKFTIVYSFKFLNV